MPPSRSSIIRILFLRVPIAREEMRLPERKKSPVLDFCGARNEHLESTPSFLRFRPRFLPRSANSIVLSTYRSSIPTRLRTCHPFASPSLRSRASARAGSERSEGSAHAKHLGFRCAQRPFAALRVTDRHAPVMLSAREASRLSLRSG